jgi:hypothetical protein
MSKQIWNWFIAAGTLVSFVGLLFLPSALNSQNRDESLLGAGLAIFSLGALIIAVAFYFKTKALRAEIGSDPNRAASLNGKRRKISCDSCHQSAPVIQCTMHKMSLCTNCLSQHYDSRACVYVPAIRKSVARMAKGVSAARV